MALTIGSRVGPYHITAEIGAGGMGVVYRAHDSRLGRDVAVKVSAERFSERFEREARAVAALNHPNICTLHDVGPDYLVMELVEGETLADVLAQRPRLSPGLPIDETLRIARQIALALDAAHDAGIVHRDLKPGNIKIRTDGTVKVLDFGLAKIHGATEPASQDVDKLTHSPTLLATQAGLILGTAAYMSPEQARGKVVDRRADIWAFGVVVYEMLAGRRPFDGEDVSTTVAAVIQSEPRWDGIPQSMLRLLKRCLTKDPRRRLRDVGDVWELLDVETPVTRSRTGTAGWIVAALATIAAAVALWAPWRGAERPADRPLVKLEIDLGADVTLPPLVIPTPSSLAISPDGTRLAYLASLAGGTPRLFLRAARSATSDRSCGDGGCHEPVLLAGRPMGALLRWQPGEEGLGWWWCGGAAHRRGALWRRGVARRSHAAGGFRRQTRITANVRRRRHSLTNSRTGGQRDVLHDAVDAARWHRRADLRVLSAAQCGHGVHRRPIAG